MRGARRALVPCTNLYAHTGTVLYSVLGMLDVDGRAGAWPRKVEAVRGPSPKYSSYCAIVDCASLYPRYRLDKWFEQMVFKQPPAHTVYFEDHALKGIK